MKYRIVTNGKKFKIEIKFMFMWQNYSEECYVYDTLEDAEYSLTQIINPKKIVPWTVVKEYNE